MKRGRSTFVAERHGDVEVLRLCTPEQEAKYAAKLARLGSDMKAECPHCLVDRNVSDLLRAVRGEELLWDGCSTCWKDEGAIAILGDELKRDGGAQSDGMALLLAETEVCECGGHKRAATEAEIERGPGLEAFRSMPTGTVARLCDSCLTYSFMHPPEATGAWRSEARRERAHGSSSRKVGRNEPCPCGSGNKFKKCCANRG